MPGMIESQGNSHDVEKWPLATKQLALRACNYLWVHQNLPYFTPVGVLVGALVVAIDRAIAGRQSCQAEAASRDPQNAASAHP